MHRIFIVEDDAAIAAALQKHLTTWGFDVRCAEDFRNVLAECTAFDPQLVLLDITLPFYNGYHWCQELRRVSNVPVVFISSASDNMNIVMAMNMGGDDFIAKPFDLNVLLAKIQAILRRTYDFAAPAPTLEHRGAVLNTADASLMLSGAAHRADEKRLPHPADTPRAQGQRRQPRDAHGKALGDGQLRGRKHAHGQHCPSTPQA